MPEFNTRAYLRSLGEELALAYGNAGHATTPGLVGEAREQAVRAKFESILPSGVAVGTGCVMKPAEGKEMPQGKVEFRTFLEKTTRVADGSWATIQNSSSSAQIYAFGFGQSFAAKPETMIRHAIELYSRVPAELRPNVVLTANQEMLAPAEGIQMSYSALGCSGETFLRPEISLEYLLVSLFSIIQNGITSPGDVLERYVMPPPMNRTYTFIPPRLYKHDASRE